jgi:UDP:flavonoid glycosyltransferase YjiC (YdhE family)
MTHFGIYCLGATGHLNTMFPLGHELQRRGHQVTVLSDSGVQDKVETVGFNFFDICPSSLGKFAVQPAKPGKSVNWSSIQQVSNVKHLVMSQQL